LSAKHRELIFEVAPHVGMSVNRVLPNKKGAPLPFLLQAVRWRLRHHCL
jgi:hypothetical protein